MASTPDILLQAHDLEVSWLSGIRAGPHRCGVNEETSAFSKSQIWSTKIETKDFDKIKYRFRTRVVVGQMSCYHVLQYAPRNLIITNRHLLEYVPRYVLEYVPISYDKYRGAYRGMYSGTNLLGMV
jgi:hypothetical protein